MDIAKGNSENLKNTGSGIKVWTRIKIPLLYIVLGFSLGGAQLPFGAVPFGFALLCTGGVRCIFAYIGACLSLFRYDRPLILFAAYTLCVGVRAVVSLIGKEKNMTVAVLLEKIFKEPPSMRVIGAAVGAFTFGLGRLIKSGFLYYDLFGALITMGAAVVAATLWYLADSEKHTFLSSLALSTLSGACVFGLRGLSLWGISLDVFSCMLISLVLIRYKGMRVGVLAALVSGLCISFDLAPLFVFGAVCYAVLSVISPILGCVSCIAVGLAWGTYIRDIGVLSSLLPALVAASILFLAVTRIYLRDGQGEKKTSVNTHSVTYGEYLARLELTELREKGDMFKKTIGELCDMMCRADGVASFSDDINDIQKKVRYSKSGLTAEVGEIGVLSHDATHTLNTDTADCIEAVSKYMSDILNPQKGAYTLDEALTQKLCDVLESKNIKKIKGFVLGNDEKRAVFFCNDKKMLQRCSRKLCESTSRVCGYTPYASDVQSMGEGWYISVCRGQFLRASIAGKKRNAQGEAEFCGDSLGMLTSAEDGRAAAFICDGMGSGREAAEVSGMCALFLQKLLSINMSRESVRAAVDMTASFLRRRNDTLNSECSSTVDICTLDLRSARARFYKCGAAQTYIFRDGSPSKLRSCTLPIGIMDKADIGYIEMELLAGDTVVMVSDGVGEGNTQFFDFVRDKLALFGAKQLSEAIIEYANSRGFEDDASVVVIKIEDKGIGEL